MRSFLSFDDGVTVQSFLLISILTILTTKNHFGHLIFFCLLPVSFFLSVQTKPLIRKSYAFYVEILPGNIHVDPDGKILPIRANTIVTIYVETTTPILVWDTAWQKGQAYLITASLIKQTPYKAGISKEGNQVFITPLQGNFLWQIQLSPISSNQHVTNQEIILKGRYKRKTVTWKTGRLVQLIPYPSV